MARMEDFTPGPGQDEVLVGVGAWMREPYDDSDQIKYVGGYAGTGKTTLAKHLARESGKRCCFAAYTGKAAYVMRSKGCDPCRTIHSLIYKPAGESKSEELHKIEDEMTLISMQEETDDRKHKYRLLKKRHEELLIRDRPQPMFTLNLESELEDYDILIIDECSMVDKQMGEDIVSFRKKILVLGDPAQLPPVAGGGYFTGRKTDYLLTEIHRQAADSGILRMATDIRKTGNYNTTPGYYGEDCIVRRKRDIDPEFLQKYVMDADQMLVGLNKTRHASNTRYRMLLGYDGHLPVAGDKVVCLRNEKKKGLLNGSLWRVHESVSNDQMLFTDFTISSEEDDVTGLTTRCWSHHFLGQEDQLKLMQWKRRDCSEFDYGYALTVHKSQGSQWDDVYLFDEADAFRQDGMARKWLYTGVTRAAKKLLVTY